MRVLLVEDNSDIASSIELTLASEGIICEVVEFGTEGIEIAEIYNYDLIMYGPTQQCKKKIIYNSKKIECSHVSGL
ncbi:hypothetical protein [Candidatus Tisiphia endosymbiont of Parasteatoda lunata]|uniref:hypothetical protein n=1 Tax=Candidatus Tisiphia endosymbiont of Parasteatoda lunata TaxID=3066275 RepID=UPI00313E59F2